MLQNIPITDVTPQLRPNISSDYKNPIVAPTNLPLCNHLSDLKDPYEKPTLSEENVKIFHEMSIEIIRQKKHTHKYKKMRATLNCARKFLCV